MQYILRVVDDELDELLGSLPAVVLEGAKAVGKTETALRRASTVHRLDDPGVREIMRADPARLVSGVSPVLIDEWQRLPEAWDRARRAVDDDPSPGRLILTGSAPPADAPTHSGAGRLPRIRMRPLSLAERGLGPPTVSLRALLAGRRGPIGGATATSLEDYTAEICRSGFPGIRPLDGRALRIQLDGYVDRIVERDFVESGYAVRNPDGLRRWMAAYGAATATTASYEVIRDAASAGTADKPARSTTEPYRATLAALWIIDDLAAWTPSLNHLRRLGDAPKHHLVDPALAARLVGASADSLLSLTPTGPSIPRDGTLLGALFESLVAQSVRVYAQAGEARVGHLRTHGGEHEVDLIVERADGRVVALEVKLARTVDQRDLRSLYWLSERLGANLLDAAVITTGPEAYRRSDGIAVIPAALLGS